MTVAVMNVRHVSVCVFHLMMPMPMRVGLLRRQVLDTVVYVMAVGVMMTVFVLNGLVGVQVLMVFVQYQDGPRRHEQQSRNKHGSGWFAEQQAR